MTVTMEKARFAYTVPEGQVYVRIRAAEIRTESRWDGPYRERFEPRVELTTDPTGDSDNPGYVKIRGRLFRIHTFHCRATERPGWVDWQGRPIKWTGESDPYEGGFRNEAGGEVGYETKTRDRLREIEREVLELFEADQPDWRLVSERQALEVEQNRWEYKAHAARESLANAEEQISGLTERISAYKK